MRNRESYSQYYHHHFRAKTFKRENGALIALRGLALEAALAYIKTKLSSLINLSFSHFTNPPISFG